MKLKYDTTFKREKLGYNFFDNIIKKNRKCYIVKSDTGTGKTTSIKHYLKNNNFEYEFARLKPFIFSYGRQMMHKILKNIPYDKVYRIYTDSILCDDDVILPVSDKIGALKIEYKSPFVEVVNSKTVIKH